MTSAFITADQTARIARADELSLRGKLTRLSVEVPFPEDLAPFKVVKTTPDGRRRIIHSARTRADAEWLLARARS